MPGLIERHKSTPLLLETIRIEEGKALYLNYHNQRLNQSRKALFSIDTPIDIDSYLTPPSRGLYRCRVLYDREVQEIEYLPYRPKTINTIALVSASIDYDYKYADRRPFERLLEAHPESDEILIIQEGLLADTTIANIAFLKNGRWITPAKPLLHGTTRERLINEGFLSPAAIRKEDISNFDGFALMNAMIGFRIINPIWLGI